MIDVIVSGRAVRGLPRTTITSFIRDALRVLGRLRAVKGKFDEVTILLVGDAEMKRLNSSWRHKNKTTDVLTFGSSEDEDADGTRRLGEIVISTDQAKRQALSERHSLPTEIRYLILHGLIHAIGFDHETDDGEMNLIEIKARARLGLE